MLIPMPRLTIEEVEWKIFVVKPWKALGDDGLLAIVWRQIWLVIKIGSCSFFRPYWIKATFLTNKEMLRLYRSRSRIKETI